MLGVSVPRCTYGFFEALLHAVVGDDAGVGVEVGLQARAAQLGVDTVHVGQHARLAVRVDQGVVRYQVRLEPAQEEQGYLGVNYLWNQVR